MRGQSKGGQRPLTSCLADTGAATLMQVNSPQVRRTQQRGDDANGNTAVLAFGLKRFDPQLRLAISLHHHVLGWDIEVF